jgi:hypothetical protein
MSTTATCLLHPSFLREINKGMVLNADKAPLLAQPDSKAILYRTKKVKIDGRQRSVFQNIVLYKAIKVPKQGTCCNVIQGLLQIMFNLGIFPLRFKRPERHLPYAASSINVIFQNIFLL